LLAQYGRIGFILPISSQFSGDYLPLRNLCQTSFDRIWLSTFDRRPSAIFTGKVGVRNSIWIALKEGKAVPASDTLVSVTRTIRWKNDFRPYLFGSIEYSAPSTFLSQGWERVGSELTHSAFEKIANFPSTSTSFSNGFGHKLWFKGNALYYLQFFHEPPPLVEADGAEGRHSMMSSVSLRNEEMRDAALAIYLSKLMYLWWLNTSDNLNVTKAAVESFPASPSRFQESSLNKFSELGRQIRGELQKNVEFTNYRGRRVGRYVIPNLASLISEVDALLIEEFGLQQYQRAIEIEFRNARKGDELDE
jgi:hypothetical protein